MRKVIQVSVTGVDNTSSTQCNYVTTALCDDGTVWEIDNQSSEWRQLPSIPQQQAYLPPHRHTSACPVGCTLIEEP